MSDRLLSKSLASHLPDQGRESSRQRQDEDMEESESRVEVLLKTRIPETIQAIGANLDRTLSILQRMERKLEAVAP